MAFSGTVRHGCALTPFCASGAERGLELIPIERPVSAEVERFEARLRAVRAHPRLDEAMRFSVRSALDYFHENRLLHRNIKDVGRLILGTVALYLDATGGLTHRRLRTLSGQTGVISAGTATAVLFRMRAIGYVTRDEEGVSGVARRYRPTAEMTEAFRERMQIELDAAAILFPEVIPVRDRFSEAPMSRAVFAVLGAESIKAASQPRSDLDPLNRLATRSAGVLILYDLLHTADQNAGAGSGFAAPVELEVSVSALARKYEVSRSHVLSLLRDMEAADFIRRVGRDGRWTLRPALRPMLTSFFGVIYLGMTHVAAEAMRDPGLS